MDTTNPAYDLLAVMEDLAQVVALHTGLRQQFIDQGWSASGAECMVLEIIRAANQANQ